MNRTTLLALVAVLVASPASDPVTGPAGVYSVTTTGPTRVTSGEGWVRIEWDVEPSVPVPPPPSPVVTPPPVVTPEKPVVVPPVVTTPSTPPPVLKGQVFLLAVHEALKASPYLDVRDKSAYPASQQEILLPPSKGGSATIGPAMKAMGISWQPRDINDPALIGEATTETNWKTEALKQGLPCVIAIGQDGQKVSFWTGPLPTDEAAAIELGKKIKGKSD